MELLNVGKIIELNELEKRRFLITKKTEGGFGVVYFLKSLSDFPNCVMKIFKNNLIDYSKNEYFLSDNAQITAEAFLLFLFPGFSAAADDHNNRNHRQRSCAGISAASAEQEDLSVISLVGIPLAHRQKAFYDRFIHVVHDSHLVLSVP